MNGKWIDFLNLVGNLVFLLSKPHSLQAFCSCFKGHRQASDSRVRKQAIAKLLMCDVISMQTCYNSIQPLWNSRAITHKRTQCVPGPLGARVRG